MRDPDSEQVARPESVRGDRLGFRPEAIRKSIHIGSVAVPIAVWILPPQLSVGILVLAVVFALAVEYGRSRIRWVRHLFLTRTRRLLRTHERDSLAGATYMAVAYLLAFLLFPLYVAVVAMLYNGVGDALAALVGKRWGRHRLRSGKSWEGAGAAFLANLALGAVMPGIPLPVAVIGAAGASLLEIIPTTLDDNLRVTVGGGAILWAALASGVF